MIGCLGFSDDVTLISRSVEEMNDMLQFLNELKGHKVNTSKSNFICSKFAP